MGGRENLTLLAKFLIDDDDNESSNTDGASKILSSSSVKSSAADEKLEKSIVHENALDSSDDEYGESNRLIVKNLKKGISKFSPRKSKNDVKTKSWDQKISAPKLVHESPKSSPADLNVFVDPIFKMRLVKPLFSATTLLEKAAGRTAVPIYELNRHLLKKDFDKVDWFTAGIIVSRSSKASSKGTLYTILTLSDLHSSLKTFSLFLFGKLHTDLSKLGIATAIGILNPSPLDNRNDKDEVALTVRSNDQVIVWGTSKDYGTCKTIKKNGEVCNAFVNTNICKTCVYHLGSEYKKFSQRIPSSFAKVERSAKNPKKGIFFNEAVNSLQPAKKNLVAMAKDRATINSLLNSKSDQPLSSLENNSDKSNTSDMKQQSFFESRLAKVPQSNSGIKKNSGPLKFTEVFSKEAVSHKTRVSEKFSSVRSSSSLSLSTTKPKVSDSNLVKTTPVLSKKDFSGDKKIDLGNVKTPSSKKEKAFTYEDFLALRKSKQKSSCEGDSQAQPNKKIKLANDVKSHSLTNSTKKIDLELSFSFDPEINILNRQSDANTSITSISEGGSKSPSLSNVNITKFLPRTASVKAKEKALAYIRRNGPLVHPESTPKPRKALEIMKEPQGNEESEKNKIKSAEFEKLLNMKSRHTDLVEASENAAQEEYFNKLEKKEELENKMLSTFKLETKAFICYQCKYTWYSLSERCLKEKHKFKCITTNKRFFSCGNCKLKKTILDRVPKGACDRCGTYQWERAAMINPRKVDLPVPKLSIRGDEEAHYSNAVAGNLNLLVPDDDK